MSRRTLITAVAVCLISQVVDADAPHGPIAGESPIPFHSTIIYGPEVGTEQCLICQFEARPYAMVIARRQSPALLQLIRNLDSAAHEHDASTCGVAAILLDESALSSKNGVQESFNELKLANTVVGVYGKTSPPGMRLGDDDDVCVVFGKDRKIVDSFVFRKDSLSKTDEAAVAKRFRAHLVSNKRATVAKLPSAAAPSTTREYWIQIEDRASWDLVPSGVDRLTGFNSFPSKDATTLKNALVFRRYKPPEMGVRGEWEQPDDRKVNPWDLNEPDPSTTQGTIPGPVIECNVGDSVVVHFRNMDCRSKDSFGNDLPFSYRVHSIHVHGITFGQVHDGAYPLSAPDPAQTIGTESPNLWAAVMKGEPDQSHKMGDRVPPGCTFTYRWDTIGWPATAGAWPYHDHSIHDMDNVQLGAIGVLVVHNPDDPDDVFVDMDRDPDNAKALLPGGSPILGPTVGQGDNERFRKPPKGALFVQLFHQFVPLDATTNIQRNEAQLMLMNTLPRGANQGFAINGRKFLGNTPTLVAGVTTKMRFALVAMDTNFHTFHLHGHRWVLPGPSRKTGVLIPTTTTNEGEHVGGEPPFGVGVQASPMNKGVSQFEDTKVFGPANSFSFTINQGSFFGPPLDSRALGEWHMHCHVLAHMNDGMMGSLILIDESEAQRGMVGKRSGDWDLVSGKVKSVDGDRALCQPAPPSAVNMAPIGDAASPTVRIRDEVFVDDPITVQVGDSIVWSNQGAEIHTATASDGSFDTGDIASGGQSRAITFNTPGTVRYRCTHHPAMTGTITVRARQAASTSPAVRTRDAVFVGRPITVQGGNPTAWSNGSRPISRALSARATTIIERKDVRDLSADEIDKYKEAVRRLRTRGNERPVWSAMGITVPDASTVNKTGYSYQALIHTNHCPHRNWWFLPWHRVYLYYYEAMLRDAVANYKPSIPLAIPYWDWTTQRDLPDIFRSAEPGNPLNDPRRFSAPITEEDVGQATIDRVVSHAGTFELFGSGPSCSKRMPGTEGPFEGGPHDSVHGDVGGGSDNSPATFGTMSTTLTSAFDPIFWSHHANLDRLWDVWLSQTGHANPDYDEPCPAGTTTWGGLVFNEFVDPNGNSVRHTVKEFLESPEIQSVTYVPRSTSPGPRPVATMEGGTGVHGQKATLSLELGKPVTLTVPTTADTQAAISTALNQEHKPHSVTFVIEGVTPPPGVGDVRVRAFLNNPRANASTAVDDPSYIGYFTFFPANHSGTAGAAPEATDYALNLTPAITSLGDGFNPKQPLQITLVLVPRRPSPTAATERRQVTLEGGHLSFDK